MTNYVCEDDVLYKAKEAIKKPFKEIDKTNRLKNKKGGAGQMMEENHFGLEVNNRPEPDFKEAGIELKVTPFYRRTDKNNKVYYRAKERLVLNIINYMTEELVDFKQSSFWKKNEKILMMFYEYKNEIDILDMFIDDLILFSWPEEDLPIVINDWLTIVGKIKDGKAHELSESDTMYLSACTKGSTAEKSLREQRFSPIKAKQRAYSLKPSYMSYILNNYVYGDKVDKNITKSFSYGLVHSKKVEKLVDLTNYTEAFSVQDFIKKNVEPYIGKTQKELVSELNVKASKNAKSINASIINNIFKLSGDIKNTEEFQKACVIPKTIRIESNGNMKEDMSFETFEFKTLVTQGWEDSNFYELLSNATFMFAIFKKIDDKDENAVFDGIKFWSMPNEDLLIVEDYWNKVKEIIVNGVEFKINSNGTIANNFPKKNTNEITHVRPHASKSAYRFDGYIRGNLKDAYELPDGRWMTKQCFWLNKEYIKKVVLGDDSDERVE